MLDDQNVTTTEEPTVTNVTQTPNEDMVQYTKSEFEQRLNNKFGEGASKAEKRILQEFGVANLEELKKKMQDPEQLQQLNDQLSSSKQELEQLKAERIAISNGASPEIAENVVALIKGKGQEMTEENVKKALAFFRTGASTQSFGTTPAQQQKGEAKKAPPRFF